VIRVPSIFTSLAAMFQATALPSGTTAVEPVPVFLNSRKMPPSFAAGPVVPEFREILMIASSALANSSRTVKMAAWAVPPVSV
jgi:hypothetical protein